MTIPASPTTCEHRAILYMKVVLNVAHPAEIGRLLSHPYTCRRMRKSPENFSTREASKDYQQGSGTQRQGRTSRALCAPSGSRRRALRGLGNSWAGRPHGCRDPLLAGTCNTGSLSGPCHGAHRHRWAGFHLKIFLSGSSICGECSQFFPCESMWKRSLLCRGLLSMRSAVGHAVVDIALSSSHRASPSLEAALTPLSARGYA